MLTIITALMTVAGTTLGFSTSKLLQSGPYWIFVLLAAIIGLVVLLGYIVPHTRGLTWFTVGIVLAVEAQLALAGIAVVKAAGNLRCEQARSQIERGRDFQRTDENDRAYGEFTAALGSCVDGRAYLYRGYVDSDFGRLQPALDSFNRAIPLLRSEERQQRRGAFLRRGKVNSELRHCDAAVVDFQMSIATDPQFDPAYHNLALVRADQGIFTASTYSGALQSIERALELNPRQADYLYTRGRIHWALGSFMAAERDLIEAVENPQRGDDGSIEGAKIIIDDVQKRQLAPPDVFDGGCRG